MMSNWMESTWTTQVGWVLLNSAWQFSLIATSVGVCRRSLRLSAPQRHRLACIAMAVVAVCPVVTLVWLANPPGPLSTGWSVTPAWSDWGERLFALVTLTWLLGIALFSLRVIAGWWGQRRLVRLPSAEIPKSMADSFERVSRRLGIHGAVKLRLVCSQVGPMVAGWFRPTIVLPMSLLSNLSAQEIELLLAHELAHVRRHDCFVNAFQVLVETLFFYHPVVWWLSREIRVSREYCCDDIVAVDREHRVVYCRALLKLETHRSSQSALTLAARDGDLLQRIRRLSVGGSAGRSASPVITFAMSGVMAAITLTSIIAPPMLEQPTSIQVAAEPPVISAATTPPALAPAGVADVEGASVPAKVSEIETEPKPMKLAYTDGEPWMMTLQECVTIALMHQLVVDNPPSPVWVSSHEIEIRNIARDVEVAYWDLYFAHHRAATCQIGHTETDAFVKVARQLLVDGTGTRQELAQAVEQAYQSQGEFAKSIAGAAAPGQDRDGLHGSEKRLRKLLGVAVTDGREIYPIDEPASQPTEYDLARSRQAAIEKSPELRTAKTVIGENTNALALVESPLTDAGEEVMPITSRREVVRRRSLQLRIALEKSNLQEKEKLLVTKLADAIAKAETHSRIVQINAQRRQAAEQEVAARSAQYSNGSSPIHVVLQSQQRRMSAEIDYFRSLTEYAKATSYISYLDGSLLANVSDYLMY